MRTPPLRRNKADQSEISQAAVNSAPRAGSGNTLTYTNSGSGFRVDGTVTDSHGLPVQVGKNVTISGTAPICTT